MLHRRHPSPVTITITILCAVNKFMSFRHATITNSTRVNRVCFCLLRSSFLTESYFPCVTKCNVQTQPSHWYLLFTRARISHDFNCRVLKIYFRRTACAHKCSLLFRGVPLRAEWKTIQDKLSTRIPTIRTLRDSLIKCLNAATKGGGGGGVVTYIQMPIHIWI